MAPDKLKPNDPRVESHTATVNGRTYHYLLGNPTGGRPEATVLLVHGFPDLSLGWRYQVPMLLSLNLRVIVPDTMGYGGTDAPEPLEAYSLKSMSSDLAALVTQVLGPGQQIILGGHDWGGALVWRMALWHPDLISAIFNVCTPYRPPSPVWHDPEAIVKLVPNFAYQLQLAGPDVQAGIVGKTRLRQFLSGMFGGRGPNRETMFTAAEGVLFQNLDLVGPSPLLTAEETDFYVDQYDRHGMRGPLNWYRTGRLNYEEELPLAKAGRAHIKVPVLMIVASRDTALPPSMAAGMDEVCDNLTQREVPASHWALVEAPEETNGHIAQFLRRVLKDGLTKPSL